MLGRVRGMTMLGCLAAVTVLALAGCGGSGSSSYAKRTAAQILRATQKAMTAATAFQAQGAIDADGANAPTTILFKVPSDIEASIEQGADVVKFIVLKQTTYIYANAAFWQKQAGSSVSAATLKPYVNKWFTAPASTTAGLVKQFAYVTPQRLATCFGESASKPTVAGTQTVDGQSTVVLHIPANGPGTAPGNLFVSTAAPHYPVRFQQTARAATGGSGLCANGPLDGANGKNVLNFSQWNAVTIAAPANAKPLPGS